MIRFLLLIGFFSPLAFSPFIPCQRLSDHRDYIDIRTEQLPGFDPADPSRRRFGALEFRGGLLLSSSNKLFGGISALYMKPGGERFLALSDHALWLHGLIVYKDERPVRIAEAAIMPVLGPDGRAAESWDTESLAEDSRILYVGIERTNSIVYFDHIENGNLTPGRAIAVPSGVKKLPHNQGLEAMVFVPKNNVLAGTLIAISERGINKSGDIQAFLIGGPSPGEFFLKRHDDFDISDAALLPDGNLLILERCYSLKAGIALRLRSIPLADIKPDTVIDGPTLLEADARYAIDNMEALSVHRSEMGEIVLTLVSDDNYSPDQRTLLLQFTYLGQ